jgi:hypothetical protein
LSDVCTQCVVTAYTLPGRQGSEWYVDSVQAFRACQNGFSLRGKAHVVLWDVGR